MYQLSIGSSQDNRSSSLSIQKQPVQAKIDEASELANRIRLLKFEHGRALKRIEETKERISDVINSRTRNTQEKQIKAQ